MRSITLSKHWLWPSSIFNRCYILCIVVALVLFFGVDHQKVIFKTLDYLAAVPERLRDYAVDQGREFPDYLAYDAVRYYKNFIRLFPDKATGTSALAFCYFHLKDERQAIRYERQAASMSPGLFGLHYNLGLIHYQRGEYTEAIQALTKAIATDPIQTINYPGVVIPSKTEGPRHSGDQKEIIRSLKQAYANAYQLIVLSHLSLGDFSRALKTALIALQSLPFDQGVFDHDAGVASYKLGNYKEAVGYFQRVLQRNGDYASGYEYLGLAWEKLGLTELSQSAYKKRDSLDKNSELPGLSVPLHQLIYYPPIVSKFDLAKVHQSKR